MPVGVVGLTRIAWMLVTRCKFDQFGATAVQPQPERAAPGGTTEVVGDLGGAAEAPRVAVAVVLYLRIGDVDACGDADEQRASQRVGQHRARDAADLESGRRVRQ